MSSVELGVYKHVVASLEPNTTYYAMLAGYTETGPGEFFGVPIRFRTHDDGTAETFSMKWVLGSCQANRSDSHAPYSGSPTKTLAQTAWVDVAGYLPDKLWDIGDFHYRGGHAGDTVASALGQYANQFVGDDSYAGLEEMKVARALVVEDQVADDHDFSANNGESGDSAVPNDSMARQLNIQTLLAGFAMYPYAEQTKPAASVRGLYGSYLISPRIRVVILDGETLDRSPGLATDNSSKTFAGTPQDTWLCDLFTSTTLPQPVLNIVICGKSWIGPVHDATGDPDGEDTDKIWNYSWWRQWFADLVRDTNTNIVFLGGDRHALGYAPPDTSLGSYHPFPVWLGSPWCMHSLPSRTSSDPTQPGEVDQYEQTIGFDLGKDVYNISYLRGTVTDDNAGTITFSGIGRILNTNGSPTDPTVWTMKDWAPAPYTDTWHYPLP